MTREILAGRVAVVTGATRGLGRGIVAAYHAEGAAVMAASRFAEKTLPASEDGRIKPYNADVTDVDALDRLMDATVETFGRLDVVVANAGISVNARVDAMGPEHWARVVDTNLTGTWHTIRSAARVMRAHGGGQIVTLSSCMARHPATGTAAYSATKAAVEALTLSAGLELIAHDIAVICIAPGILDAGLGEEVTANGRLWEQYQPHLASGRRGTVEEVARIAVFLAMPESAYLNASVINVDGGVRTWQ